MKLCPDIIQLVQAKLIKNFFIRYRQIQIFLAPGRKVKILFSNKPVWVRAIRKGFQFSRHQIAFDDFTVENIIAYDLLIPLTIRDAKFLSAHRSLITEQAIPVPGIDSINLCDDKYLLNQMLIKKGFGEFIPEMDGELSFPYILKRRIDEGGGNTCLVSSTEQERALGDLLTDPNYFTQKHIAGASEYAMHILFRDQKVICSLNIKHVFNSESPIGGNDKKVYSKISPNSFLDLFSSILRSIKFEGLCCIDYKVHNNQLWILEINPRCGGSLRPYIFYFIEQAI